MELPATGVEPVIRSTSGTVAHTGMAPSSSATMRHATSRGNANQPTSASSGTKAIGTSEKPATRPAVRVAAVSPRSFGETNAASARWSHAPQTPGSNMTRRLQDERLRRELHPERAALPRPTLGADLTVEQLDQVLADRETQARAAISARGRGIRLSERLEQPRHLLFAVADAAIANLEAHARSAGACARRHAQHHAARVGELQGLADQVHEHLAQAPRVG